MRIRTVKPRFWRSDDITKLSREDRLLFIGLWSYVDDNGVGIDDYREIAAELFALEEDQKEIRDYIREGLARLSRGFLIVRYEIEGKSYLFIPKFHLHQKVDKPNKPRYPTPPPDWTPPTSEDASECESLLGDSRDCRESPSPVVVEKGRTRPTSLADADASTEPALSSTSDEDVEFVEFWSAWPRKVGKPDARKKYRAARKTGASAEQILTAARRQVAAWRTEQRETRYIPHPATWLNQARYDDEPERPDLRLVDTSMNPWAEYAPDTSPSAWSDLPQRSAAGGYWA